MLALWPPGSEPNGAKALNKIAFPQTVAPRQEKVGWGARSSWGCGNPGVYGGGSRRRSAERHRARNSRVALGRKGGEELISRSGLPAGLCFLRFVALLTAGQLAAFRALRYPPSPGGQGAALVPTSKR